MTEKQKNIAVVIGFSVLLWFLWNFALEILGGLGILSGADFEQLLSIMFFYTVITSLIVGICMGRILKKRIIITAILVVFIPDFIITLRNYLNGDMNIFFYDELMGFLLTLVPLLVGSFLSFYVKKLCILKKDTKERRINM